MTREVSDILSNEPLEGQLEAFLAGSSKYYILPVPTPLSKAAATRFLTRKVPLTQSAKGMRKLVRLATFYNVTEAGDLFVKTFGGLGRPEAVDRWSAAMAGLAWVGGPESRNRLRESLPELLSRADVLADRNTIYDLFDAIGPEPADPKSAASRMGVWLDAGIAAYDRKIEDARKDKGDQFAQVIHDQKVTVEEFRAARVPRLERLGAQRVKVLALPTDQERIKALVPFAVDETLEGSEELRYWASIMLLRLGGTTDPVRKDPAADAPLPETQKATARGALRELIAAEFHKDAASRRDKIQDERKQAARDLYRARSLRAAYYFGHAGEPADRVWLGLQTDPGTDVLALRPDWEYPRMDERK